MSSTSSGIGEADYLGTPSGVRAFIRVEEAELVVQQLEVAGFKGP